MKGKIGRSSLTDQTTFVSPSVTCFLILYDRRSNSLLGRVYWGNMEHGIVTTLSTVSMGDDHA